MYEEQSLLEINYSILHIRSLVNLCMYLQLSMEQVTLTDLLEHFTKDDLNALGIKYVITM